MDVATTDTFTDPLSYIPWGSFSLGISYFDGTGWSTDHLPADTILYIDAFGNCSNYTLWNVFLPDSAKTRLNYGETTPKYINRFDTLEITIKY